LHILYLSWEKKEKPEILRLKTLPGKKKQIRKRKEGFYEGEGGPVFLTKKKKSLGRKERRPSWVWFPGTEKKKTGPLHKPGVKRENNNPP